METEIVSIDHLDRAVSFLQEGTPIAFPTETVYGLGALISQEEAVKKIFSIKGRPSDNPLIVHVSSLDQALLLTSNLPPSFFSLANRFWPGPLTLVVCKDVQVSPLVSGGLPSIAIRMPSHPTARRLIERTGPLVAPSANLSGRPSPTTPFDVLEDLHGQIPLILDGGECEIGIESTVVNLMGDYPVLLRPGIIGKQEIELVLRQKVFDADKHSPIASPGMKYRHYAPRAKVSLVFNSQDLTGDYILSARPSIGMRLLTEQTLYAELRRADRYGIAEIQIDCTNDLKHNLALMNRILKAAGV